MAAMDWFAKDLVPGRRALGWITICVGLPCVAAFVVASIIGWWPTWRWALFGVGEMAAAVSWYARGRMGSLFALVGGAGLIVFVGTLIISPR
jgi:hypothetical protein